MGDPMAEPCFTAGSVSKSDCRTVFRPSSGAPGALEVRVSSSVLGLFGDAIEAAAARAAGEFPEASGGLEIEDDGALDYVIEARVEAVLRLAGLKRSPRRAAAPRSLSSFAVRLPSPRFRPRRTRLYLPGDQPHFSLNAGILGADILVFDLEDAVAERRKFESRILVRRILEASPMLGSCELAVRINPLSSPWGEEDLAELVQARPQVVVVPKCESARDLKAVDEILSRLEEEAGIEAGFIRLMPIVETAKGVLASGEIALASPRTVAICFGGEDFRRDIGAPRRGMPAEGSLPPLPDPSLLARQMLVLAARAAGIDPLDSVYADLEDEAGLAFLCRESRALGFAGRGLLHPIQIPAARAAFAPSAEEAERAARIVEAFDAAARQGRGAISLDGQMVDLPVAEAARALLAASGARARPSDKEAT